MHTPAPLAFSYLEKPCGILNFNGRQLISERIAMNVAVVVFMIVIFVVASSCEALSNWHVVSDSPRVVTLNNIFVPCNTTIGRLRYHSGYK